KDYNHKSSYFQEQEQIWLSRVWYIRGPAFGTISEAIDEMQIIPAIKKRLSTLWI
ncbi:hypothetical protein SK128_023226, partial [Halocaridina rubra]